MSTLSHTIESLLNEKLRPQFLQVEDTSHMHQGHAGAKSGAHFCVKITTAQFTGLTLLQRHRLVYDTLKDIIPNNIHALEIHAACP